MKKMQLKSREDFLNESLDKFFDDVHEGNYDCAHKELTSLVDLDIPSTINGFFNCEANELTSLEGGPHEVDNFSCGNNQLATLEGCPKIITGNFSCSNNSLLKNLDHLPEIEGKLYIGNCPLITKEMIDEVRKSGKVKGIIVSSYGNL